MNEYFLHFGFYCVARVTMCCASVDRDVSWIKLAIKQRVARMFYEYNKAAQHYKIETK